MVGIVYKQKRKIQRKTKFEIQIQKTEVNEILNYQKIEKISKFIWQKFLSGHHHATTQTKIISFIIIKLIYSHLNESFIPFKEEEKIFHKIIYLSFCPLPHGLFYCYIVIGWWSCSSFFSCIIFTVFASKNQLNNYSKYNLRWQKNKFILSIFFTVFMEAIYFADDAK